MNFKLFILMILSSYLRFVSGQSPYLQLYSYYGYTNDYQYPSYSIPYYSYYGTPNNNQLETYVTTPNEYQHPSYSISYFASYVIPTYYSKYQELPNSTNTTLINTNKNTPIVHQSFSIINVINFIDIYIIVFIGMIIDMIIN